MSGIGGVITKIFGGSAKEVITSVGSVIDNLTTSKEEKEAAKLAMEQEINRHFEALQVNLIKEKELDVQDRASARSREEGFVKATGHIDFLMWFLAISALTIFGFLVWTLLKSEVPEKNEILVVHTLGIIEGIIVSLFSYYFGSSAGSRLKDMKK
jgi:hypothetical protein